MQWGYAKDSRYANGEHDEHSRIAVTYPLKFKTLLTCGTLVASSVINYSMCYAGSITTSGFTCFGSNNSDGRALPYWLAIGL